MSTPPAEREPVTTERSGDPAYRYDRILVAVDDSPHSQLALRRAEDIAYRASSELHLLSSAAVPSTRHWDGTEHPMEILEVHHAELLRAAEASISDVPVSTYLVRGDAAKRILEHAGEHDCGLIVMGTRGRGRAASALLGSTAQDVLRAAAVPVLIVHSSEAPADPNQG